MGAFKDQFRFEFKFKFILRPQYRNVSHASRKFAVSNIVLTERRC